MTEDLHDHDLGLTHDLPRLLGRRRVLQLFGVGAAAVLVGCGGDDDDAAGDTSSTSGASGDTSSTTGDGSSSGDCSVIPEETAGPYPGDGTNGPDALAESGVVRSDIRSSFGSSTTTAGGIPITVTLNLVDTSTGCAPLSGAAVYLWHCDREGRYSMYSEGVEDENYLRGVQETDSDGRLTFQSIFPACYSGRWPHMHFEVYESVDAATSAGTRYATSQLALPEDVCDTVYATEGYEQSIRNLSSLSLETDGIFSDGGGASQLATVTGSVGAGYAVELTVAVDSTSTSTGGAGMGGGGMGGGPGMGMGPQ